MEEDYSQLGLQEQVSEWKGMLNSPAWKRLERYAEWQKHHRQTAVMEGRDENGARLNEVEREGLAGEYRGINLFLRIPRIALETAESELQGLRKEDEDDEAEDVE